MSLQAQARDAIQKELESEERLPRGKLEAFLKDFTFDQLRLKKNVLQNQKNADKAAIGDLNKEPRNRNALNHLGMKVKRSEERLGVYKRVLKVEKRCQKGENNRDKDSMDHDEAMVKQEENDFDDIGDFRALDEKPADSVIDGMRSFGRKALQDQVVRWDQEKENEGGLQAMDDNDQEIVQDTSRLIS